VHVLDLELVVFSAARFYAVLVIEYPQSVLARFEST